MDPYRHGQQVGECPRCQNPTEADGVQGRLTCVAGCGEWYPRVMLEEAWDELIKSPQNLFGAQATAWPWTPARCPSCRTELTTNQRGDLRYDYCAQHGVWLDAGEIQRFAQVFELS
jgi:uncharacterized protein YbaR (Trm112 family)